ncbi:immune inhibitor A domain-containing protein [Streptomyces sp. KLOTTS4A1]|uniref:immune inhibitor A domain-containing protein n=1 Tax=Streptomyces sp. KLOTTS4A1 TaxID=3390996 RepID=UPI0039F58EED
MAVTGAMSYGVAQAADGSAPVDPSTIERQDPAPGNKGEVDHDLEGPLSEQQAAARETALKEVVSGKAKAEKRGASQVVQLDKGKYVELGREKTDKIFTILVEFGDKVDDTTMYDPDGDGPKPPEKKFGGTPGPQHNQIAEPDRSKDNSTAWQPDFNREHFQDLYFGEGGNSVKKYYEKQSSGRYSVDGDVSDWVKVEYNEARYGSNYCGDSTCASVWDLVRDGTQQWAEDQKAAGKTDAEIKAMLAEYDQWDRYDFDGDGDFNESDGYIDHFQIVHAGEDESAGGGAQGGDAIWAHRWYAYGSDYGRTGPVENKAGGTEIGDTGMWVGDYTIQPENGGLGVFAHEYGHDLGLPDLYDTAGGDNSTGYWTLMSSGSWLGDGKDSIGGMPGDMTAWDKLQLGWLNYETAKAGERSLHKLGVAEYNTKNAQALVVELPKKTVTTPVVEPAAGEKQWWSGRGDDLKNTLTRSVDLTGKSAASLELTGWWEIEAGYDYLYAEVSTDGGANFTPLDGTADGAAIPRDGSDAPALHGNSDGYKKLVYSLDAYAGQQVELRFRYQTDGGVNMTGFTADDISVVADGTALFTDGAEADDAGWTKNGFSRIGGAITKDYEQFYIAENRQYVSYDTTLKTGPYNFGWASTRPDWVEHFPYQKGLLIWKWDTSQPDNSTSTHPGKGLVLPVDAHPKAERWSQDLDGKGGKDIMRNRIQSYDSTFSWYPTQGFNLHRDGVEARVNWKLGNPVFDDGLSDYYDEDNPTGGVKITDTNTRITIVSQPWSGKTMTLMVGPSWK